MQSNRTPHSKIPSLIRLGHSHVSINSSTECRETSATKGSRLRTGLGTEDTTGETARRDTVGQVVFRAETLDTTLGAGVERADHTEVLSGGPGAGTHILETATDLLAPGEVGDGAALRGEGGVVGHLGAGCQMMERWMAWFLTWTYTGHEETEGTTETETHCTGNDCLDWTRLHTSLHLVES